MAFPGRPRAAALVMDDRWVHAERSACAKDVSPPTSMPASTTASRPLPASSQAFVIRTNHWGDASQVQALAQGVNCTMYHTQGAHPAVHEGRPGTWFSVWAPNAREVCVVGDFNYWQHGAFYLNSSNEGVWWGFLPGVGVGTPGGWCEEGGLDVQHPLPQERG